MKKKILFVNISLHSGGVEKSLVTLLSLINYEQYDVDLQLFLNEGLFLERVPSKTSLLPPVFPAEFGLNIKKAFVELLKKGKVKLAFARLLITFLTRTGSFGQKQKRMWAIQKRLIEKSAIQYDTVVAFMEGQQIYYAIDKINAKKKVGFIHGDYKAMGMSKEMDAPFFEKLDEICTVSPSCQDALNDVFPEYAQKTHVIYNIISPQFVRTLANEKIEFFDNYFGFKIVSVARLSYQKGLDIAIDGVAKLKKDGIDFRWYIIGIGPEKSKLETSINEHGLNDTVLFLGERANPYPYMKAADVYMQPSRYEGKAIAVDEAMALCKPVLLTSFSTAVDQVTSGVNGLIVPMTADGIYEGLVTLINDKAMCDQFVKNLEQSDFGNENEINKLYALI